jgi:hypothetical protein
MVNAIYILMHALFHIRTAIIPRDRYRPEGFSQSIDIGRGMITVLIWKKACINLFITYFNIEIKRTILTSRRINKRKYQLLANRILLKKKIKMVIYDHISIRLLLSLKRSSERRPWLYSSPIFKILQEQTH